MAADAALPLTRGAALARLSEFAPLAGADYARWRNHVGRPAVSRLSAALRRRLISESDVVRAVLAHHAMADARSFLGEVLWRSYWKGWLEQHPAVWTDYQAQARADRARLTRMPEQAAALARACRGETGIAAFDHWLRELVDTGYLHNWARMQFASIWVFTLDLPWTLGAALTLRHFLDGDPASNTLSWRWVAGLHTPGKIYLADPDRIAAMTGGRFCPQGLATAARPAHGIANPPPAPLRMARPWRADEPCLLVLTPDDLSLETLPLPGLVVAGVAAPAALFAAPADRRAGQDALDRAAARWGCPARWLAEGDDPAACARRHGAGQWVMPYAPVGSAATALIATAGPMPTGEIRRAWDDRVWPHCARGYFALNSHAAALLAAPD